MKKFTCLLMALLVVSFTLKAQQYVSTEPANRNVILEEFTGRGCQFCPDGHRIANEIADANPGRFWAINVHAGGYALTSYPNFNTPDGNTIHGGFSINGYPTGVVNRSTAAGQSRSAWASLSNQQLSQASECNVAGSVIVNPASRIATITVEVYYTGNSSADENYLTVAMLQDSILGSQSGMSYNPSQVIGNQYCHMHVLRDVITASAWGEAISPTTQGTLITRTYEYTVPEIIGSPNGVAVDLNNIFFLAWVSERQQGNAYRPILTGCELEKMIGSNDPVCPIVTSLKAEDAVTCTQTKIFEVNVSNIGTDTLTSLVVNTTVEGETSTFNWTGSIPRFENVMLEIPVQIPYGTHTVTAAVVEANGVATQTETSCSVECLEWVDLEVEGETEQLKLMLVQDKWGAQITWEFTTSTGEVIASGGPYNTLSGSNTTLPHAVNVTVPVGECVKFTIHDSGENGICCNDGNGYYKIFDSHNHVIIDGDGAFGAEANHLISVKDVNAVEMVTMDPQIIGYHDVTFVSSITGNPQEVGFEYKKLTDPAYASVTAVLEGNTFSATVNDLELNTNYVVRPYAVVNNNRVYGEEVRFHTWVEGVGELDHALKVYPNPADQKLYVEGEITLVEVYNTVGQCLLTRPVKGNAVIELSDFRNGIYFLRVSNNGETVVKKFSVNH